LGEWLFEAGIGEDRAILVQDGEILEAAVELPAPLRAGAVADGRLIAILVPGKRGIVRTAGGVEALLEPVPPGLAEGGMVRAEVVREALPEEGRSKLAKVRATEAPARPGPSLRERIGACRELPPIGEDLFEAAGWSELLESAVTGEIAFPGGSLRMSLTPAMTLFDVDGPMAAAPLAIAGAEAAGKAIRKLGIGGSIGIDLPTLAAKSDRQAAAAALDAVLPQPFERTAVNGFGFLQIVRRRERPSLPELLRADPSGAAARALLRKAGRAAGGPLALVAAPQVVARLERESGWLAALARQTGGQVSLQADQGLPIFGGYVHHRPA
jgi:hypothetical protein